MEPNPSSNTAMNPNLQQAYAKRAELTRKLAGLKEASTKDPLEGQNTEIVDEVTGLLRDVELEIKEQFVAEIENEINEEQASIFAAGGISD